MQENDKIFRVTDDLSLRACAPDDRGDYLVHIIYNASIDGPPIPVFANEIVALIGRLTEASVWMANQLGAKGEDHGL